MRNKILDAAAYQEAAKRYYGWTLPSTDLQELLKLSQIKYYGGKCPVYCVILPVRGGRIVVGGNYATNGKPRLVEGEPLDFD